MSNQSILEDFSREAKHATGYLTEVAAYSAAIKLIAHAIVTAGRLIALAINNK